MFVCVHVRCTVIMSLLAVKCLCNTLTFRSFFGTKVPQILVFAEESKKENAISQLLILIQTFHHCLDKD